MVLGGPEGCQVWMSLKLLVNYFGKNAQVSSSTISGVSYLVERPLDSSREAQGQQI